MLPLNEYEDKQVRHIAGWKAERTSLLGTVLDRLTAPLARIVRKAIPEDAVQEWVRVAFEVSEVFCHVEKVTARAGVKDVHELLHKDLAFCDSLADHFIHQAGEGALFRTLTGSGGGALNIRMMMSYSLQAIHTVGFCYGFGLDEPHERDYTMSVLELASANTMAEKVAALHKVGKVKEMIIDEALTELAEEAIVEGIAMSGSLHNIPLFGMAAGAVHDAYVADNVAKVAKICFQERWLHRQGKVDEIAPDPKEARWIPQRYAEPIVTGAYYVSFSLGFALAFPPLLLASLISPKSSMAEGLADGYDAANQDVDRMKAWVKESVTANTSISVPNPVPAAAGA